MEKLILAIQIAEEKHRKQTRDHGVPYIVHPIQVCLICSRNTSDLNTLISALLHDVPEDTDMSLEQIRIMFGDDVAQLVHQLTNDYPDNLEHPAKMEAVAKHAREITDPRAQLIKLADRLCNLMECEAWKPKRIAKYIINTEVLLQNLSLDYEPFKAYYDDLKELIQDELSRLITMDNIPELIKELT